MIPTLTRTACDRHLGYVNGALKRGIIFSVQAMLEP